MVRVICVACCALALAPAGAAAEPNLITGFSDPFYTSGNAGQRTSAFDKTVEARGEIVRINVLWRTAAVGRPLNPRDPADPAYDFRSYDQAVREAAARGLEPLITIYRAPDWAEGPGRPSGTPSGTWMPQPGAFGDFAHAVATRYSGSFGGLPEVRLYEAWNEPNLSNFLNPQWEGRRLRSPQIYKDMVNAFYAGVKAAGGDNTVIAGATAPYGDGPGGPRARPLKFWRDVLCVRGQRNPKPTECELKPSFDVLSHHPINTSTGPRVSAAHFDDLATRDVGALRRTLRAAERGKNLGTRGRHQIWATEIWWETNPPNEAEGVSLQKQAKWIQQALHLLWVDRVRVVLNLQVIDAPFDPDLPFADTATGVFSVDGAPKPSLTAMRFPFVTERANKRRVVAWGKAPEAGRLRIERQAGGGWRTEKRIRVRAGEVFERRLDLRGGARLRARVGDEQSLTYQQGG